jgi:DNA-binding transcriptional MerR regulator
MLTLPELQRISSEAHALRPLIAFLREQGYDLDGIARLLSLTDPPETLLTHTALHSLVH